MIRLADLNLNTPIVEKGGTATRYLGDYLRPIIERIEQAAYAVAGSVVSLTGQGGAIGLSTLVPVASGLYRVSYALQVTVAASVSSSATVTFTFTRNGQICIVSGPAVTGNTLTTVGTGSFLIRCDAGSLVSYSVAYASVGAPTMEFDVDVIAEAIG